MDQEVKASQYQEENDFFYTQERLSYIRWIKRIGYVAVVLAITQLILASVHVEHHALCFGVGTIIAGAAFLIGAVLSIYWANQTSKFYKASTEPFQPRIDDKITKAVFILGLLLAGVAVLVLVNLYMQYEYSPDWIKAQATTLENWNKNFEGKSDATLVRLFKNIFTVHGCFVTFYFFYFLSSSRAAFRCLKWDNMAMSYLVFLGNILLLAFGLGVVFYANHAFGFEEFPQIRAHFPLWNVKGLHLLGLFVAAISLLAFLVDHRSWRVGFFVLSFLLLVLLVFLVNFTGYAYRFTRQTYEFYKGIPNIDTCLDRMNIVHASELENYGCPAKYVSNTVCSTDARLTRWEGTTADNAGVTATPALFFDDRYLSETQEMQDLSDSLMNTQEPVYLCRNEKCCGLLAQLYTEPLLSLANYGLLTTLAGCLVSIGCYYFWYVTWIDTARNKSRDFLWLGIMGLITVVFLIVYFTVDLDFVKEKLDPTTKRHLDMSLWE